MADVKFETFDGGAAARDADREQQEREVRDEVQPPLPRCERAWQ